MLHFHECWEWKDKNVLTKDCRSCETAIHHFKSETFMSDCDKSFPRKGVYINDA
jgi:hypothetical protein